MVIGRETRGCIKFRWLPFPPRSEKPASTQSLNQVSYAWGHNKLILFAVNVYMCFYVDSIAENRRSTDNEI
ncbi:MAG: hypothetical protein BWY09_02632 [Candidatus Hydrogenedentes bacterium ADurb.Bin179]|nr:MAG: hypothetical protein BWY09_02632 [Candidatus Hydrogenedentes bacterium ADurb.Bin179]